MNAIITDGPAWYAIALYKGDDAELPLVIDEGDAPTFTPVDITGSTFKMEIEKKRGGAAVLTLENKTKLRFPGNADVANRAAPAPQGIRPAPPKTSKKGEKKKGKQ